MVTLFDLFNRPLEAGDAIILKNIEAQPVEIADIAEVLTQPHPNIPPMREIKLLVQITLTIPGQSPLIPAFLVRKGEKKSGVIN